MDADRGTSTVQLDVPAAWPLLDAVAPLEGVALLPPPHLTLAWRWLPAGAARGAAPALAALAARTPPLPLALTAAEAFPPDGRGRVLLHAVPEEDAALRALAGAVLALAGRGLPPTWQPHLSVARVRRGGAVAAALDATRAALPVRTVAAAVQLRVQHAGRWSVAAEHRLGGG